MMLHEIVADGRSAFLQMLADPMGLAARASETSDASQLWVLGLMRFDQMMQNVCAFRWCELALRVHENELPGLFEYFSFLVAIVPPDEVFCPAPIKHANGEHSIPGLYAPPDMEASLEGAPGE